MARAVGRARLLGVLRRRHGVELQQPAGDVALGDLGVVAVLEEGLVLDDDERIGLRVHSDGGHLHRSTRIATPLDRGGRRSGVGFDARPVVEDRHEAIRRALAADGIDRLALRVIETTGVVGGHVAHDASAVPIVDLLPADGAVRQGGEQRLDSPGHGAHDAGPVVGVGLARRIHHRGDGEDPRDGVGVLVARALDEP